MISKFFIERPVLANVLAILMVVIGAVSLYRLPEPNIRTWFRRPFKLRHAIRAPASAPWSTPSRSRLSSRSTASKT